MCVVILSRRASLLGCCFIFDCVRGFCLLRFFVEGKAELHGCHDSWLFVDEWKFSFGEWFKSYMASLSVLFWMHIRAHHIPQKRVDYCCFARSRCSSSSNFWELSPIHKPVCSLQVRVQGSWNAWQTARRYGGSLSQWSVPGWRTLGGWTPECGRWRRATPCTGAPSWSTPPKTTSSTREPQWGTACPTDAPGSAPSCTTGTSTARGSRPWSGESPASSKSGCTEMC